MPDQIFLINYKRHNYGFVSTLSQARCHMTNPFSTTSFDPNLMCMYSDQLANMALNNNHSRGLFQRGCVVDNKSACVLSTRYEGPTDFSRSVDSRKMMLNLICFGKII